MPIPDKKHILYITTNFPPTRGSGSRRTGSVVKYLNRLGWNINVLSFKKEYYAFDEHDEIYVPKNIHVMRSKTWFPFYRLFQYFAIPDKFFGWIIPAYQQGIKLVRTHNTLVYATGPYFSTFLIGWLISRKTGAKLILEYRDPWSRNDPIKNKFPPSSLCNAWLEKKICAHASTIITTTEAIQNQLLKYAESKKINIVPNGFDEENVSSGVQKEKIFNITYTGTLNDGRDKFLTIFETALNALLSKKLIDEKKMKVKFLGGRPHTPTQEYPIYEHKNFVDYSQSLKEQNRSSIVLFLDNKAKSASIPAKLYEYFASQSPILAITYPNSPAEKIINATATGVCVYDVPTTEKAILQFYKAFYANQMRYSPIRQELQRYTYNTISKTIDTILNRL